MRMQKLPQSIRSNARTRARTHIYTQATKSLDEAEWKRNFEISDVQGKGSLSFAEFRRAVRRANIKPSAISDADLQAVVKMVDTDGSGFIELDEFMTFLRPEQVPDIECRASSWASEDRRPEFAVNGIGLSVTHDNILLHTGATHPSTPTLSTPTRAH
jgi:hypothetical protein